MYQPVPSLGMVQVSTIPRAGTVDTHSCESPLEKTESVLENTLGKVRGIRTGKTMYEQVSVSSGIWWTEGPKCEMPLKW